MDLGLALWVLRLIISMRKRGRGCPGRGLVGPGPFRPRLRVIRKARGLVDRVVWLTRHRCGNPGMLAGTLLYCQMAGQYDENRENGDCELSIEDGDERDLIGRAEGKHKNGAGRLLIELTGTDIEEPGLQLKPGGDSESGP
ncbi:hypothetical protein N658DRAFT_284945 [Parathielavia hyrcaniae]|uniref:Uncharacterized protein n=1 Tax=Parathielavia hyrcaniae TaxID=113614 RepID=A0AAN6T3G2_9PEZI|nr:hypothetical protein N658DRAFT_284945 [Parathielavia hyrcaniae]